ncbi:MAG: bifunctional (p)ppGpp synthetase/guanosine-3',5'-bis(diphosphate) 3'-pyrophosphohydrolase [Clostridia bacterium]|nr:bifunctional (p)ppGpp synthetase/guanosine-3',5'-bis(diphosphate) 3'-pyrophosphohydrolase [Clostridia bacterium]
MVLEDKLFSDFRAVLEKDDRKFDLEKIERAYVRARGCHEGQTRSSGEAYVCHPIEVAKLVYEFGLDSDSIAAAFLHDTIEDTELTFDEVKKEFGLDCANLVDGVTKLGKIAYTTKEEAQIEYLRKMFLAMAKDIRVILIKLADRLHNVRTLAARPKEKQLNTAKETLEIYAPLAHRLGMQKVKLEMEDISISYLDPEGCKMIHERLKEFENVGQEFLDNTRNNICEKLKAYEIPFELSYRVKHTFSIYRKMFQQNKSFEELYDLYAFRLIVDSITDCYYLLGAIHDLYNPIPGRFKDYISTPKPNMYQSLHTTVIGKEGIPFEVQIRTWDMHNTAEYGIAAHWKYKGGIQGGSASLDDKLKWVRTLMESQEEVSDTEDFIKALKIDLFDDEVFVFTPKGDVVNLPAGATVIDFAYAIHSAVGNRMVGAKVNGKIVGLEYTPKNGEIIEILTSSSENRGPSRDWLKIVKTSEAKNKIRHWIKRERRDENIATGMEELEKALRRSGIRLDKDAREEILGIISERLHFNGLEDLYAAIGYGGITVTKVEHRIRDYCDQLERENRPVKIKTSKPRTSAGGVVVEGIDNCLIKFAKCCNPLPGDYICGFITRGYGVSVHKTDCINARDGMEREPERWLKASWDAQVESHFTTTLMIHVKDAIGVMADLTRILADLKVNIRGIQSREEGEGVSVVTLSIEVKSLDHLKFITSKIKKDSDVIDIQRMNQ